MDKIGMRKAAIPLLIALALLLGLSGLLWSPGSIAAPLSVPTPVSGARSDQSPRLERFFTTTRLTADTRSACVDAASHTLVDLQWNIDQGTVNTITLKTQFSNDVTTYVDGVNVLATSAVDATGMNQFQLFGAYLCLFADLTNGNVITVTANGLMK